jgi:hypothetical protein
MHQFWFTIQIFSGRDGNQLRCVWVIVLAVLVGILTYGQKSLVLLDDHKHSCTSYTDCSMYMHQAQLCTVRRERLFVVNQKSGRATLGSSSVMPNKPYCNNRLCFYSVHSRSDDHRRVGSNKILCPSALLKQ